MRVIRGWGIIAAILVVAWPLADLRAQEAEFTYDLFSRHGRLTIWIDLSAFLSPQAGEQIKDGIDLAIQFDVTLKSPRRFLGDRRVAAASTIPLLRYRPVTEDYLFDFAAGPDSSSRQFVSMAGLYQYLRDSIEVPIVAMDSLDSETRLVTHLKVTTISLSDISLQPNAQARVEESPLRFLFRQFLEVTGYGRREFEVNSRPFSLTEIEEID
jgi:hypothetical protein